MSEPSLPAALQIWAAEVPQREAVVFLAQNGSIERVGYRDLRDRALARATILQSLPPASRVGLIAPHGPDFLVDALAILLAGHCLVPINGDLPTADREELQARAGIHALLETGKNVLQLFPGEPIDGQNDAAYRAIDPAYLRFTSGSTGLRKGVLLGHRTILERTAAANAGLKISAKDRVLCLLPMVDHFVVSILLYLRFGATILLVERNGDAADFADAEAATVLYGSPADYRSFQKKLPHVRLAISTTQGLSESVAAEFLEKTGRPLVQALGIIEAGLLTLNQEQARDAPLLLGKPMAAYQITAVPSELQDCTAGEIHVAGPGLLDAYVAPWRPRAEFLRPTGFPTGDHGWIDQSGCLHLMGRGKNRLEIAGKIYYSEELEALLNADPAILESLVFLNDEALCGQVILHPGSSVTALHLRIGETFPVPLTLQEVLELPRTATGKLARPIS